MDVQATITDLRRLYHHVVHGGSLQGYDADRIARGIRKLESMQTLLLDMRERTPHPIIRNDIDELLNKD